MMPLETFGQGKAKPKGPPPWAPAHNSWQVSINLPSVYAKVDLKGAYKVELELDTDSPQKYNADHKIKYKPKAKNSQVKVNANKSKPEKGKGKKKY